MEGVGRRDRPAHGWGRGCSPTGGGKYVLGNPGRAGICPNKRSQSGWTLRERAVSIGNGTSSDKHPRLTTAIGRRKRKTVGVSSCRCPFRAKQWSLVQPLT